MDITYHYPPDLFNSLITTIPLLCRSKKDLIAFFAGAGINRDLMADVVRQVEVDKESISKYEIVRTILTCLNERGERTLRERRELLKRVVEFESFSTCWPADQLKAKGGVAEIKQLVEVKDSFTRMRLEREGEARKRREEYSAKVESGKKKDEDKKRVHRELVSLFNEINRSKRGHGFEKIMNDYFNLEGILVREGFTVSGDKGEGVVEQIDGVVEVDGELYLVEFKWRENRVDIEEVSRHLVRVFHRGHARGIFISASGYTPAAIKTCKEALHDAVIVLCNLKEVILLLEARGDLLSFLKAKINAAILDKNPLFETFH